MFDGSPNSSECLQITFATSPDHLHNVSRSPSQRLRKVFRSSPEGLQIVSGRSSDRLRKVFRSSPEGLQIVSGRSSDRLWNIPLSKGRSITLILVGLGQVGAGSPRRPCQQARTSRGIRVFIPKILCPQLGISNID